MKSAMENYPTVPKRIRSTALESLKQISEETNAQNRSTQQDILHILRTCIDSVSITISEAASSDEIQDSDSQFESESTRNGFLIISNSAEIVKRDSIMKISSETDLQLDGDEIITLGNKLAFTFSKSGSESTTRTDTNTRELIFSTDNLEVNTGMMESEEASGKTVSENEYSVLLPKENILGYNLSSNTSTRRLGVENTGYVYNFIKWKTNLRKGLSASSTLLSDILQFTLYDHLGAPLRILNLSDPIILQIKIQLAHLGADCHKVSPSCAAFDLFQRRYRQDGMRLVAYQCHDGVGTATCLTDHLSEFALINTTQEETTINTEDQAIVGSQVAEKETEDNDYSYINSPGNPYIYIYIYYIQSYSILDVYTNSHNIFDVCNLFLCYAIWNRQ